jgi:hypothetical protein
MRVMEQAASVEEMRTKLLGQVRAGCAALIAQVGSKALQTGLSQEEATDIVFTMQAPYLYSMFTVDLGWSADRYEEWLADAVPRLLLRQELLG